MLKRPLTQLFFLVGLHASWGPQVKWFCNPVLSCHSCTLSFIACPIGVLVHYSGYHLIPFLALGTLMLIGSLGGRIFCGWVCPFGFLQDLLHKIPSRKWTLPAWTSSIKYGVLFFFVFLFPFAFGETTWLSFCRACPAAALEVGIPAWIGSGFAMPAPATLVRFGILVLVIAFVIATSRGFCRLFCPIGALMAPFNRVSLWAVRPMEGCLECGKCDRACPTACAPSVSIRHGRPPSRALDCIVCHDCQPACPRGGAGHSAAPARPSAAKPAADTVTA